MLMGNGTPQRKKSLWRRRSRNPYKTTIMGILASFMMCSILLNPQLIIYSTALGMTALVVRIVSCFLCGIAAGLLIFFLGRRHVRRKYGKR